MEPSKSLLVKKKTLQRFAEKVLLLYFMLSGRVG
jgi:hypothetical protein